MSLVDCRYYSLVIDRVVLYQADSKILIKHSGFSECASGRESIPGPVPVYINVYVYHHRQS